MNSLLIFHFWWKANLNTNFHWIKFLFISHSSGLFGVHAISLARSLFFLNLSRSVFRSAWHAPNRWNDAEDTTTFCMQSRVVICIHFNLLNCQLSIEHYLLCGFQRKAWHSIRIRSGETESEWTTTSAQSGWLKWFLSFHIIDFFFAIDMFDIINERASHQEVLLAVLTASDYRRKMIIN